MNLSRRNNIISLVIIHLLLLVYPLVSKFSHEHHHSFVHHVHSDAISFENSEESCPICDFEFYNFIPGTAINAVVFLKSIPVINSPEPAKTAAQIIYYFSLRAPPSA